MSRSKVRWAPVLAQVMDASESLPVWQSLVKVALLARCLVLSLTWKTLSQDSHQVVLVYGAEQALPLTGNGTKTLTLTQALTM